MLSIIPWVFCITAVRRTGHTMQHCVQYCAQCGRSRSKFYFCNISRNNCTVCPPHCTQCCIVCPVLNTQKCNGLVSTDSQNGGCDDVIPVGQNRSEKDSKSDEVFWLNYSPVLSPNSNIPLPSDQLS